MNQNKLSFDSENLIVDWISFKFQKLENSTQRKIANYLFKLGFNSYQESGKLAKPIKELILVNSKNKFEVLFVKKGPYWDDTTVHFSGLNGKIFYSLIKQELIHLKLFSSATLGRFDFYYSQNNKRDGKILIREFFENCQRQLKQTNKNISFEKNTRGLILKIENRRSNNYSQIYQVKNSLKFEYEMKGKFLQKYHFLLISNHLE